MKVRVAKKLLDQRLPTRRIRTHIEFLDAEFPEWPYSVVEGFLGRAVILAEDSAYAFIVASPGKQVALPIVREALAQVQDEGPLVQLYSFADYVEMNPNVLGGNPVLRGTRLETQFLSALRDRGVAPETISEIYHLQPQQVGAALSFQQQAA